jgi:hypothetical protein
VVRGKKIGGAQVALTPPGPVAAVSASCRPFSYRPLQLSLPCVPPWNKADSACFRRPGVTTGGLSGPPSYKM